MLLKIAVSDDRLTIGDLIALEEGKMAGIRDVFARLAVDDKGEYLGLDEGRALVSHMTLRQLKEQAAALAEAVKGAVPPTSAGG